MPSISCPGRASNASKRMCGASSMRCPYQAQPPWRRRRHDDPPRARYARTARASSPNRCRRGRGPWLGRCALVVIADRTVGKGRGRGGAFPILRVTTRRCSALGGLGLQPRKRHRARPSAPTPGALSSIGSRPGWACAATARKKEHCFFAHIVS